MRFDLTAMARARGKRRNVTLRDIRPSNVLATDLYRSCYLPLLQSWQVTVPRLMLEYERSLSALTTDSPADLDAELDRATPSSLYLILTPQLRDWVFSVERWQRGQWTKAILAATSVDLSTILSPADVRDTLETTIARNIGLIKDVDAQARARMATAVFDGLRNRTPARDVAKQLRETVDFGRRRSIRIASDQLSKISSALADERRREAGLTYWKWMHSGKNHPRANHVARDGKLYSDKPNGVGRTINDQAALPPPTDRPGQLPFCGCRSLSVLDLK